jgi:hypothetical protein
VTSSNGYSDPPIREVPPIEHLEHIVIENSSAGLVMVTAEVPVTVTREEHHQHALARYAVAPGGRRHVAAELGWCVSGSGTHVVEVRLDGQRVGELTHLMSQRYAPLLAHVASRGGRIGCEAVVQTGVSGLEVVLRLPRDPHAVPFAAPLPVMTPRRRGVFSAHRPAWIAAAVVGVLVVIGALVGEESPSSTTAAARSNSSTAVPATTVSTTTVPTTTVPTTTVPTTTVPTTTVFTTTDAPAPAPPVVAQPAPQSPCDPNYTGCVPVASDVDCEGGSGNGPAYVAGPIRVIGSDVYDLDRDGNGVACES